ALQISMSRRALASASVSCMSCRLLSRDAAEHRADRHAESRKIAAAQDVACHDLARGEQVGGGLAVLHDHLRLVVHPDAQIGEGDAGPQRVAIERWRID